MEGKKNVLAISGSTRRDSSNESVLQYIERRFQEEFTMELYTGLDHLPYFNPDRDTENISEQVLAFRTKLEAADGILICTPEYIFSLPGVLKNAIEWTVSTTLLLRKPVAFIVASGLGEKAFESLTLIMETVGARMTEDSRLLVKGSRGKIGADGNIADLETIEKIEKLGMAFLQTMKAANTVI